MKDRELYIGVMSGTSLDGVDVVLTAIEHGQVSLQYAYCHPIPETLKQIALAMNHNKTMSIADIGEYDHRLGHLFADAVNALLAQHSINASDIKAIGNHGQTVYHHPSSPYPFTVQLGDANIIATKTGITTIADFRRKDMALGGQGAPLVPAFHKALFQPSNSTLVVLNIGGIANVSVMQPNKPVYGYDTGPGNGLMDAWCQEVSHKPFDKDGELAASGNINAELLIHLLEDNYFKKAPPKSTGREYFHLNWLKSHLQSFQHSLPAEDVQATLLELTTLSITNEVNRFTQGEKPTLLVCGGGAQNTQLMKRLKTQLPHWEVTTTDQKGISSDYMEAMAFAWLAYCRIHAIPSNLPEVTGASRATPLGVIYHAD